VIPCLLIRILLSHLAGVRAGSLTLPEHLAQGIAWFGKVRTNGRAPPLARLLRIRLGIAGIFDLGFMSTQDHRAVALSCQSQIGVTGLGK